jgi:hypothetical protein
MWSSRPAFATKRAGVPVVFIGETLAIAGPTTNGHYLDSLYLKPFLRTIKMFYNCASGLSQVLDENGCF